MSQQQIEDFSSRFVERLRALRGDRTKAEFARFLGINSPQTYQQYETDRVPNPQILTDIATRCRVTVDWLLGRTDAGGPPPGIAFSLAPVSTDRGAMEEGAAIPRFAAEPRTGDRAALKERGPERRIDCVRSDAEALARALDKHASPDVLKALLAAAIAAEDWPAAHALSAALERRTVHNVEIPAEEQPSKKE